MILVDTSVWIDHFRRPIDFLLAASERRDVLVHDFVIGEIALGSLADRAAVLRTFENSPRIAVAPLAAVRQLIEHEQLFSSGIGYVDAHLVAAARARRDTRLWTRDRRLMRVADRLGCLATVD